jgi:23S rRNA (guanosine2251-2'-O)-methyltransferase
MSEQRKRQHDRQRKDDVLSSSAENIIFGQSPVLEALRSGKRRIDRVLISQRSQSPRLAEIIRLCNAARVKFLPMTDDQLCKLLPKEIKHQGVIAMVSAVPYADEDEVISRWDAPGLFVVLDGIEDPRNLGAIIRTAECAGANGIFIPERRAVGLTGSVARSSAGAVEHIPVAKVVNLNRLIEKLKNNNVWVVGAASDADLAYTDWDWKQPSALVLGSEGSGLHRLVAENCDALVKIPMYGRMESLNVSVAAGVILFEAQRQRAL